MNYSGINLEGLKNITKTLTQESTSDLDLKSGLSEFKAGMLILSVRHYEHRDCILLVDSKAF
jgi:hypothetical protein